MTWAAFIDVPAAIWQNGKITHGFTGHEQLDPIGLVHMNGRVYDPELGRFLSADPFVADLTNLQSLNRYSYVENNPLSYTDPSGYFLSGLFKAIGHFFSHLWNVVTGAVKAILKSSIFRSIIQLAACAFGGPIGCIAAAGGLTLATGGTLSQALEAMAFTVMSMGVWGGVGDLLQNALDVTKILVHGVVNGALSLAQGGNFFQGFAAGAAGEGAEVGIKEAGLWGIQGEEGRFIRSAVAGGTASVLTGGKFANGAVSAAFAHLYNEEPHAHLGEAEHLGNSGYNSPDEAARAALDLVNSMSISQDIEYGVLIYRDVNSGLYGFTGPISGVVDHIDLGVAPIDNYDQVLVGDYHTHGDYGFIYRDRETFTASWIRTGNPNWDNGSDYFSVLDIRGTMALGNIISNFTAFLGTPSGEYHAYNGTSRSGYRLK